MHLSLRQNQNKSCALTESIILTLTHLRAHLVVLHLQGACQPVHDERHLSEQQVQIVR